MSNKLWVAHETSAKTFGPTRVSIDGCEYVDDFLKEIKKEFALSAPSSHLTLYTSDGITKIKPNNIIQSLQDSGNSRQNPLIVKTLSFALNIVPTLNESPLIGQVLSVSINQNKLIKKYLIPVGSTSSTPVENFPSSVDISSLSLQLEKFFFYQNTITTPCIVIDVQPRPLEQLPNEPPTITIVLITGFGGQPLGEVMAEEELKRVMPIHPTSSIPGTATPINTTPEWMPHLKRKTPSYILCIPIKVYAHNLSIHEDSVRLDVQNLQKLKTHILALGGVSANADFVDLEEDDSDDSNDSDDDVEVRCHDFNREITWDEISM